MNLKKVLIITISLVIIALLTVVVVLTVNKGDGSTSSFIQSSSQSSVETLPEFEGELSINTGFEDENSKFILEAGNGATMSINSDQTRVFTGEKSLKIHVSEFAVAQFKFSDYISEKVIKDYESLSFWVYSEYQGVLAISNGALNGSVKTYINNNIQSGVWTKISITKGSDLFNIIQYNLSFNSFTLNAMGNDYGKVVEYDLYIDDIRLYKDGLAGECTLALNDGNGGNATKMPVALAGVEYVLPSINVFSPEGYALYNADAMVEKSVYDQNGNAITINDGKIKVDKAGLYYYDCYYTRDGILNRLSTEFEVVFADFKIPAMGVAMVGQTYELPSIEVYEFGTENALSGANVSVQVENANGQVQNVGNTFTPTESGEYTVAYTIESMVNQTLNVAVVEKALWVKEISGLVADFTANEEKMFAVSGSVVSKIVDGETYKMNANGNKQSLKLTVNGDRAITLGLTESFPYANASQGKYLSMWIYNGSNLDLRAELSTSSDFTILKANGWSLAVFNSANSGDLINSELLIYDAITQQRLTCNLFIDDVRFIRENDSEEVLFTDNVTTDDYNWETGEGRRYAANYEYQLDLSLFSISGEKLQGEAIVESIKDKRNRKVAVKDGKYFTPTVVGSYTITLSYTNGDVLCSIEKYIEVTEQMLLSPDESFGLKPAEQNVLYKFDTLPVLWNYGVIDNSIKPEVLVYDESGAEITIENYEFIPTKAGKYTVFFLARDTQITSSNALLEVSLVVYKQGKFGVVADFEDGNSKALESTTYYYGEVSDVGISTEIVHGGNNSAVITNVSNDTREMKFNLATNNLAGDISNTKYFSFWIYIEDASGDNTYQVTKTAYANWINERDPSFVVGSLNVYVQANRWVEIRVERENYETVLGGTIFAGQTISCGGSMWAAENNDYITQFVVQNMQQPLIKGLKVYVDDFTLGY